MKKGKAILITDGGGRGAALVAKYAQSNYVNKILCVPGNDLMQINTKKTVKTYPHLKTTSINEILEICKKEKVDLVDVAQDNAVEQGLVNELNKLDIPAFGPTKEAGQIEWDKAWSREFMAKYNIPHPSFKIFKTSQEGINYLKNKSDQRWFVKAFGLVEGKGALPAENNQQAIERIHQMKKFGDKGKTYLLEQWLDGEEFSSFALCDGKDFLYIGSAQDHKRVYNRDLGPNTGGMGCVSNPLIINADIKKQILKIFEKTVNSLMQEKRPYKGVLYLGGIVVNKKIYVIEFNARWGDPEAEVILPSIKNDLYSLNMKILEGGIKKIKIKIDKKVRVAVAGTSKGYPGEYSNIKGKKIFGIENALRIPGIKLYGAGIKMKNHNYLAWGGRVFFFVGEGKNVIEARQKVYSAATMLYIEGNNLHYRTDIGWKDVERITQNSNRKTQN